MNLINKNLSTAFLLPVYNSEILLSKTLDSLFKQDYKDFKIYIINNGSSDNTEFLLKKYANNDSRIISFNLKEPNLTKALCFGIKEIQEELILRIDAGDTCEKDRVRKTINFMQSNPSCAISYTDYYSQTKQKLSFNLLPDVIGKEDILFFNKIAHSTLCLRKSVLNKFCLDYAGFGKNFQYYGPSQDLMLLSISKFVCDLELAKVPDTSSKIIKGLKGSISLLRKNEQAEAASTIFLINNLKTFRYVGNINLKIKSIIGILINLIRLLKYKVSILKILRLICFLKSTDLNNNFIYQKVLNVK